MRFPLRFRLLLLCAAALASATPVTLADGRLTLSAAECQDGTCCVESGATCVVGTHERPNKYYKSSGSCTADPTQPLPPP